MKCLKQIYHDFWYKIFGDDNDKYIIDVEDRTVYIGSKKSTFKLGELGFVDSHKDNDLWLINLKFKRTPSRMKKEFDFILEYGPGMIPYIEGSGHGDLIGMIDNKILCKPKFVVGMMISHPFFMVKR